MTHPAEAVPSAPGADAAGVRAAGALVDDALSLLRGLGPEQWEADSACHGWRVQDVVTHMAWVFHWIADPELPAPPAPSRTAEALNDAAVNERADWTPREAFDYYAVQARAGLAALELLQTEPFRQKPVKMRELGTYRLAQLADAVTFDHLVHLTCDLLAPHGPLAGAGTAVDVAVAIDPAVDWMVAGLPAMCGAAVDRALRGPVGLRLTGATERTFVLHRDPASPGVVSVTESDGLPSDVATTAATDFLRWATRRSAWRPAATITGDRSLVAPVLDAIRIV